MSADHRQQAHPPGAVVAALVAIGALAGCGLDVAETPEATGPPQRIVSLDFCADQYVLRFAERERILAVSPDAERDFSYMRELAAGVPTVRPVAEDVIILQPDLVVRSYGGGPGAATMFARAGVPVYNIGFAEDFPAILRTIRETALALGSVAEGQAVATRMQARLADLHRSTPAMEDHDGQQRATALYMTPAGVTSGRGSLIHEMFVAAGLENFQGQPGWRSLPLERLAYEQPDLVAAAFFGSLNNQPDGWSPARHPIARAQIEERPAVTIEGAWTACGAWFLMDAVEALGRAAGALVPAGAAR